MAIDLKTIRKGVRDLPPKVLLYGTAGIGKTTWAACAPEPIFLFTEDGQGQLDVASFPLLTRWEDVLGAADALLEQDHEFNTVVLDSIDFAESLCWQYIGEHSEHSDFSSIPYGAGYNQAVDQISELLYKLDQLRLEKNMAIIVIGHEEIVRFEDPMSEAYDVYMPNLHRKARSKVLAWADNVFFAHYRHSVVKETGKFGSDRKRAVGTGERVIATTKKPAWEAKNRLSLPEQLPLDWDEFMSATTTEEN